jgi:hypothetical protein
MQPEKESIHANEPELSDTWQALLGGRLLNAEQLAALKDAVPTLESDPWSALLHDKGVEMLDLQQLHLHMSDQDVEQALQMMQEQSPS